MKYYLAFLLSLTSQLSLGQDKWQISTIKNSEYILSRAKEADSISRSGQYDSAIGILKNLLPLCEPKAYTLRSKIYFYLGVAYVFNGEVEQGVRSLLLAAAPLESTPQKYSYELSSIYNSIAVALNRTRDNKEAFIYLQKAEKLAIEGKQLKVLTSIYTNRGRVYKEMKEPDKSLADYNKALSLLDSLEKQNVAIAEIKEGKKIVYTNMGQLVVSRGAYREAIEHGRTALQLTSEPVNPYYQIPNLLLLGTSYFGINENKLTEKYLEEALTLSLQYNVLEGICESYLYLAQLNTRTGNYKLALGYHILFKKMDDSIRGLDKMKSVKNMELKYRVAQKDKEIMSARLKSLEQERTIKSRNFSVLIITIAAVLLVVTFYFLFKHYKQKARLRDRELQVSVQDKKIAVLKAMMEGEEKERSRMAEILHDGIGSIISAAKMNFSTAHSTAIPNKNIYENGLGLLDEAAKEIRNTAHNLMPEKLVLEGLQAAITSYSERITNKVALDIECEFNGTFETMDNAAALLVYRIVQELINNVLKHAEATKVFVQANYTNGLLNLAVEDNGKGMDSENESAQKSGMGLKTIRAKINVLNGEMTVLSGPQKGTQVYIDLDC